MGRPTYEDEWSREPLFRRTHEFVRQRDADTRSGRARSNWFRCWMVFKADEEVAPRLEGTPARVPSFLAHPRIAILATPTSMEDNGLGRTMVSALRTDLDEQWFRPEAPNLFGNSPR